MERTVQLIDERELARITGLSLSTLRNYRHLGRGIPYLKLGRSVRYDLDDVQKFLDSRKITTSPV